MGHLHHSGTKRRLTTPIGTYTVFLRCAGCRMNEDASNISTKGIEGKMQENPRRVLTIHEAASFLRLSPGAIRAACRRGEIKALKVGKEWRISSTVLDELLNN